MPPHQAIEQEYTPGLKKVRVENLYSKNNNLLPQSTDWYRKKMPLMKYISERENRVLVLKKTTDFSMQQALQLS